MGDLPDGAVTFFFTDVEGSTRLWESDEASMSRALAGHDELLNGVVDGAGGRVFKHLGDGICAAFSSVGDAIAAALHAQRALLDPPESMSGLRIRVALHLGVAEERGGDYFGVELSRVARLLDAAHGGQTLLTGSAADLLGTDLPDGARVEELGTFRLRDLSRPVRVFQLTHPDLPAEFPPLRTLEAFANNLPIEASSFVGRGEELSMVSRLLGEARIVTLTGAGGSGKTRLALQAAADALVAFPDGVWLVELAGLSDTVLIADEVAARLRIRDEPGMSMREAVVGHLGDRRLLLVLDNCEHMIDAVADLVEEIVHRCAEVVVLATSREALRLDGESTYHVPPLPTPDPSRSVDLGALGEYAAVELFVERARQRRHDFALTSANASAVAQVCARLDGLPLALELAAAQVRMLSIDQIKERLDDRFNLLSGGTRSSLARHRTLHAAVEWSYDLARPVDRALLRRLSVFVGGFSLEGAEAVGGDESSDDVLEILVHLVDASLVEIEELASETVRYRMLETIRQFMMDKLLATSDSTAARQAHAYYYRRLAGGVDVGLREDSTQWVELLEAERDNLRAALAWALTSSDIDTAVTLAAGLGRFWASQHNVREGVEWYQRILTQDLPDSEAKAEVLEWAAHLSFHNGQLDDAATLASHALELSKRLGNEGLSAQAAGTLAATVAMRNLDEGVRLYREAAHLARDAPDRHYFGSQVVNVAWVSIWHGDTTEPEALLADLPRDVPSLQPNIAQTRGLARLYGGEEAEAVGYLVQAGIEQREVGNGLFGSYADVFQARALLNLGRPDEAAVVAASALDEGRNAEAQLLVAWALQVLGRAARLQGDLGAARHHLDEALSVSSRSQLDMHSADTLDYLAHLAHTEGRPADAVALAAQGAQLRQSVGAIRPVTEETDYRQLVGALREQLDEETYSRIWEEATSESRRDPA